MCEACTPGPGAPALSLPARERGRAHVAPRRWGATGRARGHPRADRRAL